MVPVTIDAGRYTHRDLTLPRVDAIAANDGAGTLWMALTNVDPVRRSKSARACRARRSDGIRRSAHRRRGGQCRTPSTRRGRSHRSRSRHGCRAIRSAWRCRRSRSRCWRCGNSDDGHRSFRARRFRRWRSGRDRRVQCEQSPAARGAGQQNRAVERLGAEQILDEFGERAFDQSGVRLTGKDGLLAAPDLELDAPLPRFGFGGPNENPRRRTNPYRSSPGTDTAGFPLRYHASSCRCRSCSRRCGQRSDHQRQLGLGERSSEHPAGCPPHLPERRPCPGPT